MPRTLYGIKQCDTVRRARKDLDDAGVDYRFHDFRVDGLEPEQVRGWVDAVGIDTVLNRRGTTWRQLKSDVAENAEQTTLIDLMVEHPTLIKRPVFERDGDIRIGYASKNANDTLNWFR